jgi:hypothetical protein
MAGDLIEILPVRSSSMPFEEVQCHPERIFLLEENPSVCLKSPPFRQLGLFQSLLPDRG